MLLFIQSCTKYDKESYTNNKNKAINYRCFHIEKFYNIAPKYLRINSVKHCKKLS